MTTVEEHNFKIAVEHAGDVDFIRYLGKLTAQGVKYRSEITHVSVTQPVTQAPFTPRSHNSGEEFEPVEIEHRAYIFEGDFYRTSIVFGHNHDNISLYEDQLDGWPAPPAWFEAAAERMRAVSVHVTRDWSCPRCWCALEHEYKNDEGWDYCTNPACNYEIGFD